MKKILTFVIIVHSFLFASSDINDSEKKIRTEKQIQKAIAKEEKYSKEKEFYLSKDYDFKGAKVVDESLPSVPNLEIDDLDMDSVYD